MESPLLNKIETDDLMRSVNFLASTEADVTPADAKPIAKV
jgi:hypothetical protein